MNKETEHKLHVLAKVACIFNQNHITWAVGASLLLYFKEKTDIFHDIDIMILESDVPKVKKILSEIGTLLPANPNPQYKTRHFIEAVVDDVDLDIMAGFVIVNAGKDYDCSLKKEEIKENILIFGQTIPLHSLEKWNYYYTLMGRMDKVRMLS